MAGRAGIVVSTGAEAGVTRQTVYRYFPGLEDILRAVAPAGAGEFAGRLERHLAAFGAAAEAAVDDGRSFAIGVRAVALWSVKP